MTVCALGDMNHDGLVDLVIGGLGGSAGVVFQDPDGVFRTYVNLTGAANVSGIVTADLNGDGCLDVALVVPNGPVQVILQDGSSPGTFLTPSNYFVGNTGEVWPMLASGDLDGDGKVDLVVANPTESTISVLLQDPNSPGIFLNRTTYPTGQYPVGVVVADFNGDGRLDLVSLNQSDSSISYFQQDPSSPGTFLSMGRMPTGGSPVGIALWDGNGDGLPDLVTSNTVGSVSLLLNTTRFAALDWSSLDPNVATVDAAGNVTGVGIGTARIQATFQGTSAVGLVKVEDLIPPTFTFVPGPIVVDPTGPYGAQVTLPTALASDNYGTPIVTNDHSGSNFFPLGMTVVTFTARDSQGNVTNVTMTVTVIDHHPPQIAGITAPPASLIAVSAPDTGGPPSVFRYSLEPDSEPVLQATYTGDLDYPWNTSRSPAGDLFVTLRGYGSGIGRVARLVDSSGAKLPVPQFNTPHGMAFHGGELYVVNLGLPRILRIAIGPTGTPVLRSVTETAYGGLRSIEVSPSGEIFASSAESSLIQRFLPRPDGSLAPNGILTGGGINFPHGMAFSPSGELFVTNPFAQSVSRFVFDANHQAIPNGILTGNQLNLPVSVTVSPTGEVFVASQNAITANQAPISRWLIHSDGHAAENGYFTVPELLGEVRLHDGKLYVVSWNAWGTDGVVDRFAFDSQGNAHLEASIADPGLRGPWGLAFSDSGDLFVSNRYGNSVSRFSDPGRAWAFRDFVSLQPEIVTPHGSAFKGDTLVVVDIGSAEFKTFRVQEGGALQFITALPSPAGSDAREVAVSPWGEIFISAVSGTVYRYLLGSDGILVPNGEITGNGLSNCYNMAFSLSGELFVVNYAQSVSRFRFDSNRNVIPNGELFGATGWSPLAIAVTPWGELLVGNHFGSPDGRGRVDRWLLNGSGPAFPLVPYFLPTPVTDFHVEPGIIRLDDIEVEQQNHDGTVVPVPSVTDISDAMPTIIQEPAGPLNLGQHHLTYTATDSSGNVTTAIRKITVIDTRAPVIVPPPDITVLTAQAGGAPVLVPRPVVSDVCDSAPVLGPWYGQNGTDVFPIGTTSVQFTATDASGNTAAATTRVTVRSRTPVLAWAIPADIGYGTALGTAQLNATANVPGTLSYSPSQGAVLPAGLGRQLNVTFTPADAGMLPVSGSVGINVLQAPLKVCAKDFSKVYGAPLPTFGVSYSGFVAGENSSVLSGVLTFSTAATASSPAGTYPITPGGLASSNYAITFQNGTLTVTRAPLTIKSEDKLKIVGAPNPPFTATYTGFVNGDTPASLSSPVQLTTPATTSSPVGQYPISAGSAASGNYSITFAAGTLKVQYAGSGTVSGEPGHQVLQPINADGSSVFKQGSTVSVKFRVGDVAGNSLGTAGVVASFSLVQIISGTSVANVNEAVDPTNPDTSFRWDAAKQQWVFNLSTKSLKTATTYVYRINLDDGTFIEFRFGLR